METKLLVEINNMEQAQDFINKGVGALLLNVKDMTYTKQFNCYTNELSLLSELAKKNNVELFINLDMLYHEDDLIGLRAILKRLHKYEVVGIMISDVGVIEICKELGLDFKFYNGGSILNTNYATIKSTSNIYDGYYLSNEINIDEMLNIAKETDTELIVQVFGKQKVFNSKRKLLSAYYDYNELSKIDFHPRNRILISDVNETDNYSYIYEDQYGTYIYTRDNVSGLNYVNDLIENNIKYLYINNLFCDAEDYSKIVDVHYKYLNDQNYSLEEANTDLEKIAKNLSESFFNDETVYTIEQAKLLEMELKNE